VFRDEYRSLVGKPLYAVKKRVTDCGNSVRDLSTFLECPSEEHWKSLGRIAGNLKGNYRPLKMRAPQELRIEGCVDSDWASDKMIERVLEYSPDYRQDELSRLEVKKAEHCCIEVDIQLKPDSMPYHTARPYRLPQVLVVYLLQSPATSLAVP
jgi:hypothetical protein